MQKLEQSVYEAAKSIYERTIQKHRQRIIMLKDNVRRRNILSLYSLKSKQLQIPKLHQQSNIVWRNTKGPLLQRTMAKHYNLLQDLMPYETEVSINLKASFNGIQVGRGNLILPDIVCFCLF